MLHGTMSLKIDSSFNQEIFELLKFAKWSWFQRHITHCKFPENIPVGLAGPIKWFLSRKAHLTYSYNRRQSKNYIT